MDLTTLTDEELSDLLDAVLAERENRDKLARIPQQIEALRAEYVALGGDPDEVAR